jgi:hypothetical protein
MKPDHNIREGIMNVKTPHFEGTTDELRAKVNPSIHDYDLSYLMSETEQTAKALGILQGTDCPDYVTGAVQAFLDELVFTILYGQDERYA